MLGARPILSFQVQVICLQDVGSYYRISEAPLTPTGPQAPSEDRRVFRRVLCAGRFQQLQLLQSLLKETGAEGLMVSTGCGHREARPERSGRTARGAGNLSGRKGEATPGLGPCWGWGGACRSSCMCPGNSLEL